MQGADRLNVERCGFFEQVLHLCAVFADDAEIVAASLASPVFLDVKSAEFAESVGGEKRFGSRVIGDHDFGPVHHGGKDKSQLVRAEREGRSVLGDEFVLVREPLKEVFHHGKSLCGRHERGFRIVFEEVHDVRRVVRLHVLDNEIVGLPTVQNRANVVEPFVREFCVHRIEHGDFLVHNHIRVVSHAVGHDILPLKEIDLVVVDANVENTVCKFHICSLSENGFDFTLL